MAQRTLALFHFLSDRLDGKRRYSDNDIATMIAAVGKLRRARIVAVRAKADGTRLAKVKVDRRDELIHRVELAAVSFAHATLRQSKTAPSRVLKGLNSIAARGRRLRQALAQTATDENGKLLHTEVRRALQAQFAHWADINRGYPFVFPDIVANQFQTKGDQPIGHTDYAPDLALQRCVAAVEMLTGLATRAAERQQHRVTKGADAARHKGDVALRQFIGDLAGIYLDVFERRPAVSHASRRDVASGPFIRFVQAALIPHGINLSGDAIAAYVPRRSHFVKSAQEKI